MISEESFFAYKASRNLDAELKEKVLIKKSYSRFVFFVVPAISLTVGANAVLLAYNQEYRKAAIAAGVSFVFSVYNLFQGFKYSKLKKDIYHKEQKLKRIYNSPEYKSLEHYLNEDGC